MDSVDNLSFWNSFGQKSIDLRSLVQHFALRITVEIFRLMFLVQRFFPNTASMTMIKSFNKTLKGIPSATVFNGIAEKLDEINFLRLVIRERLNFALEEFFLYFVSVHIEIKLCYVVHATVSLNNYTVAKPLTSCLIDIFLAAHAIMFLLLSKR